MMKTLSILGMAGALAAMSLPSIPQAAAPAGPVYEQALTPHGVRLVQRQLRAAGFYGGAVDGVWGARSAAAVSRFQAAHRLEQTGRLNAATVSAMGLQPADLLAAEPHDPSPGVVAQPLALDVVRSAQQQLRRAGVYAGPADGIWGPDTQAAIRQFQRTRGMEPSGDLNPATAIVLGLDPNDLRAQATAPTVYSGSSGAPPDR